MQVNISKRIYPIGYYVMLPEETYGILPRLGITSSSLLEKDKTSSGSGNSGPFSVVCF
jgi:hypothetical protein